MVPRKDCEALQSNFPTHYAYKSQVQPVSRPCLDSIQPKTSYKKGRMPNKPQLVSVTPKTPSQFLSSTPVVEPVILHSLIRQIPQLRVCYWYMLLIALNNSILVFDFTAHSLQTAKPCEFTRSKTASLLHQATKQSLTNCEDVPVRKKMKACAHNCRQDLLYVAKQMDKTTYSIASHDHSYMTVIDSLRHAFQCISMHRAA